MRLRAKGSTAVRVDLTRCAWLRGLLLLLFGGVLLRGALAAEAQLTWLWGNPLPHGNHIYEMLHDGALTVQVGDRGRLYTSDDDALWTLRETGTWRSLRGVSLFQGRVVVSGEAGTLVTFDRTTLSDFKLLNLGTEDWLEGVAASPSLVVTVGDNGAIYTSPDAVQWKRVPTAFNTWLRSVAYAPPGGVVASGAFVAVGEGGVVATSVGGVNWLTRQVEPRVDLNKVIWTGSLFIAVGARGSVFTSATGNLWVPMVPQTGTTNELYTAAVGDSTLLVGGESELRLLTAGRWLDQASASLTAPAPRWTYYAAYWDGLFYVVGGRSGMLVDGARASGNEVLWGARSGLDRFWLWDATRLGDLYVAVGDLGTVMTSADGANWDLELTPSSATNSVMLGVAAGPGLSVAVGTRGTILTSSNGVAWSAVDPRPTSQDLQGVGYWGQRWWVTGGGGTLMSSPDGRVWTPTVLSASFLSSIAGGPTGLVTVGEGGKLMTSPDGESWTPRPLGTTNWVYRVRHLGGLWVAVGEGGTILTSGEGDTWVPRASGTTRWLNDVAWFNGWFYVFGTRGVQLASTNAVDWIPVESVTSKSIYAAVADESQVVVVGVEGAVLRGQAGPLLITDYQRVGRTNRYVFSGSAGTSFALQASSDLRSWETNASLQFLDNTGLLRFEQSDAGAVPAARVFRGRVLP